MRGYCTDPGKGQILCILPCCPELTDCGLTSLLARMISVVSWQLFLPCSLDTWRMFPRLKPKSLLLLLLSLMREKRILPSCEHSWCIRRLSSRLLGDIRSRPSVPCPFKLCQMSNFSWLSLISVTFLSTFRFLSKVSFNSHPLHGVQNAMLS